MKTNVQLLAIWSIVMLLIPAGAIYAIDNYELGIAREAINNQGTALFSRGYAHSLPDGDTVSATDKTDFEATWGGTVSVDDTYWDTNIYGPYPIFSDDRGRDAVSVIGDDNVAIINYTGFGTIGTFSIAHWTSLTAYELAEYDAIAINTTIMENITGIEDIWIGVADGGAGYWLDGSMDNVLAIDNQTTVFMISQNIKTDLLALAKDGRVWLNFDNVNNQVAIYEFSIELLTFETEFAMDPMTAYGVVLLLIIVTTIYTTLLATPIVGLTIKKSG